MSNEKTGFSHELPYEGKTNDWITPKYIIDAFGVGFFDLDPCASVTQPWACATKSYTVRQDGFFSPWFGNVWLNPPYGPHAAKWIKKLVKHGEGVALIFARTETKLWQNDIFTTADSFLFIRKRMKFYLPDGGLHKSGSAGAPSCLIAWSDKNSEMLLDIAVNGDIPGAFVHRAICTD